MPPSIKPDDPLVAKARKLRAQNFTIRQIVAKIGKSHGWVCAACKGIGDSQRNKTRSVAEPDGPSFREDSEGNAILSLHTTNPIKTMDDAIAAAGVDTSVWYVDRWECSQWTVPMNVPRPKTGSIPIVTQQYRVRLYLRRILPRSIQDALALVFDRIRKHAPKYPRLPRRSGTGEPHLAVFGLFDAHFGKLAWKPETGNDYDLKIAEKLFRHAVEDLLVESRSRRVERVLLPLGNDFFHVDNRRNTTFHGTPQDVDSRYPKIFAAGKMAVIWAIELLAGLAPVDLIWVPGNHDPTMSYHLVETVASWFRSCPHVSVDVGPTQRKYYSYGTTLLGFTHGDVIKPESLPSLMASEKPAEWGASKCREWLIGHMHRSRTWVTKSGDTHHGTIVRVLRALTGTDAWHHEHGYVGAQQAAEVYFYGKTSGYVGHAIARARG